MLALKDDGTVWSWGYNGYGQLGRQENGANADMVGDATYLNEYTMDTSKEPPVEVPPVLPDTLPLSVAAPWRMTTLGGARIYGIYAGGDVSGAITAATDSSAVRNAYLWGTNENGQLGRADTIENTIHYSSKPTMLNKGESESSNGSLVFENPLTLAMSGTHAGAVKNDYYVWDWGKNDKGQLGNASNQDSDEPVHAGDGSSKALVLNQYRVYTVSPDTECLYGEEATESGRREAPARQDLGLNEVLEFDLNDITNNHFNGFNLHSDGEVIDSNVNDFTIVAADNSIVKVEINESTGSRLVSLKPQGKLGATSVTIIYENQRDKLTNTKVMPVVVRHFDSYDEKVKVCSNCGK